MNIIPLPVLLAAAITATTFTPVAQKEKRADVTGFAFFTAKKRGAVPQFVPGLTAALQLSEQQKEQLVAARDELLSNDEVAAARRLPKSDPSITTEQREKARTAVEAANAKLRDRVKAILTPEQQSLVEKINQLYAVISEESAISYQDRYGAIKDDPAARNQLREEQAEDVEAQFVRKLSTILSPEQRQAMATAAKNEKERELTAAAYKKPAK